MTTSNTNTRTKAEYCYWNSGQATDEPCVAGFFGVICFYFAVISWKIRNINFTFGGQKQTENLCMVTVVNLAMSF